MQMKALLLLCFSVVLLIGGVVYLLTGAGGFGQIPPNELSTIFLFLTVASLLLYSAIALTKNKKSGYYLALILLALLFIFFTIRFFMTHLIAPPAVISLISATLFLYLLTPGEKRS